MELKYFDIGIHFEFMLTFYILAVRCGGQFVYFNILLGNNKQKWGSLSWDIESGPRLGLWHPARELVTIQGTVYWYYQLWMRIVDVIIFMY